MGEQELFDQQMMRRALELARQGLGRTSPNPAVGAVVVRQQQVVGEGYHLRAGTPHAEVHALSQAGANACGATLYVTLEPCAHHGRTPPCTEAILAAGIGRVVVAVRDPNPQVAGRGISILRQRGVEVIEGIMEAEARRLNEAFFKYITTGLPWVVLKTAMTLDGKIATRTGSSRWVTGPAARQYVHHLRNRFDAIMVGIDTVLADDPQLTTRLEGTEARDPVRIILDSRLRLPLEAQVVQQVSPAPTLVLTTTGASSERRTALEQAGIQVVEMPAQDGRVDLGAALQLLAQRLLISVLVEGGSEVAGSLLQAGYVDVVYSFIAPKLVGGREAPGPVGGKGVARMDEAVPVADLEISKIGDDILLRGYVRR